VEKTRTGQPVCSENSSVERVSWGGKLSEGFSELQVSVGECGG